MPESVEMPAPVRTATLLTPVAQVGTRAPVVAAHKAILCLVPEYRNSSAFGQRPKAAT